jgi:thiol:disulfide interchange protein DsbA
MDSIAVNSALMYAEDLSNRYQAAKLPAFVVNGRYIISLKQAGSPEKLFKILDYLIDKELASYRYQAW